MYKKIVVIISRITIFFSQLTKISKCWRFNYNWNNFKSKSYIGLGNIHRFIIQNNMIQITIMIMILTLQKIYNFSFSYFIAFFYLIRIWQNLFIGNISIEIVYFTMQFSHACIHKQELWIVKETYIFYDYIFICIFLFWVKSIWKSHYYIKTDTIVAI